ncbi:MAG TPA: L-threonylcarbamoyladenylate synthase [Myxococcaceae bacterium]|nr:L-threonylcarbamoyladenylate synthase [Myxococcaceae bacterium]
MLTIPPMERDPVLIAVEVLREGGLVALPTETVYGLGADADNELAVRQIFAAKGRPASHPLIVHIASAGQLEQWARIVPDEARALANAFWPGPLTLILPKRRRVSHAVTGDQDTVGLRVPAHPLTQRVLAAFGGGVAAPSANKFGRVSPTTAEHVRRDLGAEIDYVLDGGPCTVGVESTIVDLSSEEPAVLRPGGLAIEDIERVLGRAVPVRENSEVRAPGQLASHYAPRAGLVLTEPADAASKAVQLARAGQRVAVIAPAEVEVPTEATRFEIPADPPGFARELYRLLREIDAAGYDVIVAAAPPESGLGVAVRDRLRRAAAPRS